MLTNVNTLPQALKLLKRYEDALTNIAHMKCDGDTWHSGDDDKPEDIPNDDTHEQLVDALCIARESLGIQETGPIKGYTRVHA